MNNWQQTLISRLAAGPIINSLISSFNAAVDPSGAIATFLQQVLNVNTAVGNGLDIWGTIVGVKRVIPGSPAITLGDPDFRTLILAKAAANIGNVTVPTLNKLLRLIFAAQGGLAYVQDNLNMSMTYVFGFYPTTAQQAIVENSGVLPRPAGVLVNYEWPTTSGPLFGFDSNNAFVAGFDIGSWAA